MRFNLQRSALTMLLCFLAISAFAQTVTITGNVTNSASGERLPAVSVSIKGTNTGIYTDDRGGFKITTATKLPFTLIFSSVGFDNKEVNVTSADQVVNVTLTPNFKLGEEIVVAASRMPERLLESPVSIERVSSTNIRNAAAPSYYDVVANLKGVDLTTSSLNFKTISTRGFNGSGNLRFNQLVDGMDNQAPGLNFSVGTVVGLTELDVDNMELLVGASSALYGSGGMNGTLLINSKNPFKYQGLSFQIKQGINHIDGAQRNPAPYYDWTVRWGKKVSDKFAFKLGGQFIQAQDWQAQDYRNLSRNNVFSSLKGGDRQTDPNYDGVNVFGDEASASMASVAQAAIFGPDNTSLGSVAAALAASLGRAPTQAEIVGYYATSTNPLFGPLPTFAKGLALGYYGGQLVSRTGYEEMHLVDYNTYNVRLSGGLYYNITPSIEASLTANWGTGTTVYTGADRYSLTDLIMGQYKLEFKGSNWSLKGYTIQENSGNSYTATTAALFVNRAWKSDATWFGTYSATYAGSRVAGLPDAQAHFNARNAADAGRYLPGTAQYDAAFEAAKNTNINDGGAKFNDKSDLYHVEGQVNLSQYLNNVVDVLLGASFRQYSLNSRGTIFADTAGAIGINEVGGYLQLQKALLEDKLKLTGSVRYDKNENFDGRFTPRVSAVYEVVKDNFVRASYQSAYRFPSNQDQYINLLTGGANRLIGGLPEFETFFKFNTNPAYTAESVVAYRNSISLGSPNPTLLKTAPFTDLKPESVNSIELGYKGLVLQQKLLIDVYGYYAKYEDFIGRVAVGRGKSGDPNRAPTDLASPFTTDNYSFVVNREEPVKSFGWGIGAEYKVYKNYNLVGNVYSDQLSDLPDNFVAFYNTPKYRFNLGINNSNVYKGWGFNAIYKWQDEILWEGTFGTGPVPAYGALDAMVSYRFPGTKNLLKIGGSNIANKYYRSAFGNPAIGALYYVSFGYNVF